MPDAQVITVLTLGFVLGARHALDADHVVAVSTILSRRPDLRASGFIGFCWGFGHTAVLLLVGLVVITLKITIPEAVAQILEFGVGLMLVMLGAALAMTIVREGWHLHLHSHQRRSDHTHGHWLRRSLQPLLVGMVHGLAGSAALMLMVLSTVSTLWEGVAYILVFGVGSILGMMLLGLVISLPLVFSASFGRRAQMTMQGLASLGSIGLGLAMMSRIGLGESLF